MICDDLILWAETKETWFVTDVASQRNRRSTWYLVPVSYIWVGGAILRTTTL